MGGMLKKLTKKMTPKIPPLPPPVPMADQGALDKAKKKMVSRVRSKSGRDSTILGSADKLGG